MTNQLKALEILKILNKYYTGKFAIKINEAIEELENLQSSINASIEEIEWALAKPLYADVYLNNALRFLKERV